MCRANTIYSISIEVLWYSDGFGTSVINQRALKSTINQVEAVVG